MTLAVLAVLAASRRVALAASDGAGVAHRPPVQLPALTLRDQFDRPTTLRRSPESAVVVLVADRDGSEAAGRWARALRTARATGPADATHAVRLVSVADLKGVPRLLRGVIRRAMPRDTATPVLLDWDSRLGRLVRGQEEHLVAAAYGRDGRLRRWAALPLDSTNAALAQALVRAAASP